MAKNEKNENSLGLCSLVVYRTVNGRPQSGIVTGVNLDDGTVNLHVFHLFESYPSAGDHVHEDNCERVVVGDGYGECRAAQLTVK